MKKKGLLIACLLVTIFSLTGCAFSTDNLKKKSPEDTICDKADDLVEKYNNDKISYSDLVEEMLTQSKEYCEGNDESDLCSHLNYMKSHNEAEYTIKDCSNEQEEPVNFKSLCETLNKTTQNLIDTREETNDLYVSTLKIKCDSIKEK